MQIFCRNLGVKLAYFDDGKRPDLNALLTAAKHDSASHAARLEALKGLEAHNRYLLNPLSHNALTPLPAADVEAVIHAVEALLRASSNARGVPTNR